MLSYPNPAAAGCGEAGCHAFHHGVALGRGGDALEPKADQDPPPGNLHIQGAVGSPTLLARGGGRRLGP